MLALSEDFFFLIEIKRMYVVELSEIHYSTFCDCIYSSCCRHFCMVGIMHCQSRPKTTWRIITSTVSISGWPQWQKLFCWVENLSLMALKAVNELVVKLFHAVMQHDLCNVPQQLQVEGNKPWDELEMISWCLCGNGTEVKGKNIVIQSNYELV